MENLNKDKILQITSLLIIFFAGIFWFFTNNGDSVSSQEAPVLREGNIIFIPKGSNRINGPSYNYDNMVLLIGGYRQIEKAFYSDFELFVGHKDNFEKLQLILEELKKEREIFRKYLQKVKAYYKRFVPTRKNNSLRYYFRVLDTCIDETEEMVEKFSIKANDNSKINT